MIQNHAVIELSLRKKRRDWVHALPRQPVVAIVLMMEAIRMKLIVLLPLERLALVGPGIYKFI